jgi:hypothetical protein
VNAVAFLAFLLADAMSFPMARMPAALAFFNNLNLLLASFFAHARD